MSLERFFVILIVLQLETTHSSSSSQWMLCPFMRACLPADCPEFPSSFFYTETKQKQLFMRPNVKISTILIQLILTNVQILVKAMFYIKSLKNVEINILSYNKEYSREIWVNLSYKTEFRHGIGAEETGENWRFFWYSDNNILTAPGQFCEEMKKKM